MDSATLEALARTRYELRGELGHGASSVVFRALDPERSCEVALKAVRARCLEGGYRLKREFRLRAGIEHPNLVQLYEFEVAGPLSLYTMELVDGVTFDLALAARSGDFVATVNVTFSVVQQVASALLALNAHGVTHRDVKPRNVMITPSGRVVLIDFDLSKRSAGLDVGLDSQRSEMVGTLPYMAPEVALGADATLQSDLYSLAALAYEALTGAPPWWSDDPSTALTARLNCSAPELPKSVEQQQPLLAEFIAAALQPEGALRPAGGQLAALLALSRAPSRESLFCGRQVEMEVLATAEDGRYHAFVVAGPSGIGKTALVEHALAARQRARPGLTLVSRCYPAERIPFNAVDGWVDGIAAFLRAHPEVEPASEDRARLAFVFPQLARLERSASPPAPVGEDVATILPRARAALARILTCMAESVPVRLFVDDFQWCDLDSLAFFKELHRRRVPILLFVATREGLPEGAEWFGASAAGGATHVGLSGLDRGAISELAKRRDLELSPGELRSIYEDTAGNPFFLHWVLRRGRGPSRHGVDEELALRCDEASPEAVHLLSLLCLAGAPVARALVHRLSGPAAGQLLRASLLTTEKSERRDALAPAHDRISTFVRARLSEAQRLALHVELADALIIDSPQAAALIAHHLSAAGRRGPAATWHETAGRQAESQFAWRAAMEHYAAAVDGPRASEPELWRALARASESSGKPKEAARAWSTAASLSKEPLDNIRAAEVLWGTGEVRAGKDAVREVLARSGLRFYSGSWAPLAVGAWWRRRAKSVRPAPVGRAASEPRSSERLLRGELCFAIGGALAVADAMGAYALQGRAVYEASKTGVPEDLVRALGPELIYVGATGQAEKQRNQLRERLALATVGCSGSGSSALSALCVGYEAFLRGELAVALRQLEAARGSFRELNYLGWPSKLANRGWAWVLWLSGRYKEFREALAPLIEAAHDAADWLTWMQISALSVHESLLGDDAPQALRRLEQIHARALPEVPFGTSFVLDHARWQVEIYGGDWERANSTAKRLRRAWRPVMRFAHVRVEYGWFVSLQRLAQDPAPGAARFAERQARALLKESLAWPQALGHALVAAVEARAGRAASALSGYSRAARSFAALGFEAHAEAAELQAAALAGNADERQRLEHALQQRGVGDLRRWLRITMPGSWTERRSVG